MYIDGLELSRLHRIILRVILWHLTEESRVSTVAEIVTFDVGRRGALSLAVMEDGHEHLKLRLFTLKLLFAETLFCTTQPSTEAFEQWTLSMLPSLMGVTLYLDTNEAKHSTWTGTGT